MRRDEGERSLSVENNHLFNAIINNIVIAFNVQVRDIPCRSEVRACRVMRRTRSSIQELVAASQRICPDEPMKGMRKEEKK